MKAVHWLWAGALLVGSASAASAQDRSEVPEASAANRVTESFTACRAITVAEARLQCFDKAAAALEAAIASKEVRILDRADVRKARRSLFGFTIPRIRLFGGGDDEENGEEAFTEINSTVAWARSVANNRVEIRLADDTGAVWQTTDPMNFPPRPGAAIRIRKGAMGNYFLAVDGRTYRGMRLR